MVHERYKVHSVFLFLSETGDGSCTYETRRSVDENSSDERVTNPETDKIHAAGEEITQTGRKRRKEVTAHVRGAPGNRTTTTSADRIFLTRPNSRTELSAIRIESLWAYRMT